MNTKLGEQYPVAKKNKIKGSEQRVTSIISVANYLSNKKYNKIPKMIDYHQPDLSSHRTVYKSCL